MLAHDGFKMVAVFCREGDGGGSAAGHGEQLRAVKINLFSMMPHILKKRYQDFHSVPLAGAADYGAAAIGYSAAGEKGGNIALSFLIILFKFPWALVTTGIGLFIGVIGLIYRATQSSPHGDGLGFAGGALWFEWGNAAYHATTFGCVVNAFGGSVSDTLSHELVHSRQYIYMHDWLGVFFFTIAGIWGVISSAIADTNCIGTRYWDAHNTDEIGNPIEIVPTHRYP